MQRLRRWATRHPSPVHELAIGTLATVTAVGLRAYLEDSLPPGFPFVTLFPAVTLTGFFASTRAGVGVAIACGLAAMYMFIPPAGWAVTGASALAMGFYIVIVTTDLTLLQIMRRALIKLDDEKRKVEDLAKQNRLMFHELQHRVSNNLQVMSSILKMQQRNLTDEQAIAALDAAAARLQIVSGIQRALHNPKNQTTDLKSMMSEILPLVVEGSSNNREVTLSVEGSPLVVTADQAIPVGLIVVELVSNCIEHAETEGPLHIAVTTGSGAEGNARLSVADNGKGMREDFVPERSRSLGLRLAFQFTQQLRGTLVFESAGGTCAVLEFPPEPY